MKNNVSARIMESMLKESQFKSNTQGKCPVCNGEDLDYDAIQMEGDMAYFPWICKKCKAQGEEWYSMEFSGHNVNTEEGNIEVDL